MKPKAIIVALLALLVLGIVIFRYRAGVRILPIDPHAAGQIEKAKQR